nr:choline/ethanolaminephosphotransferase 1-like [Tanacetum cinerariifolium]
MILSHLCDEPKGLKTNICPFFLPIAIANRLTAGLTDGIPRIDKNGYFSVYVYLRKVNGEDAVGNESKPIFLYSKLTMRKSVYT